MTHEQWCELRELAPGDVFVFLVNGGLYMVLDRRIDGIVRVVDQEFDKLELLGCTRVIPKEK